MKKLSAVLALLICALFFVFAACEEKEEETDIPEQPEQPSVSYEVTDGEWRAALDESVLDDISYTYTMTQGARSACARISVLRKDGSILRHEQQTMTEGSSSQTQEFYFEYTQNGNYQYTLQDDGLWLKTQTSVFPGEQTYFFVQLKDAFSDFAFNGENHTYHASDVTVTIADAYTYRCAAQVKFENKKLLSVRLDMQTETEETLVHLYEFNGTADVALPSEDQIVSPSSGMSESDWENALDEKIFENLPDDYTDETQDKELTEEEWLEAFDTKNIENVTYVSTNQTDGETIVNTIRIYTDGTRTLGYTSATVNGTKNNEVNMSGTLDYSADKIVLPAV